MGEENILFIVRSVRMGLRWLKSQCEYLNEARDIAVTITALVAAERNPYSHPVQRLVATLLEQQKPNGSWNDELWDTAEAVKALVSVGFKATHRQIEAALRFFDDTQDPIRGSWYEDPFETTLVLDVLIMVAPEKIPKCGDRALDWLLSLQSADGYFIGARYTGAILSLFNSLSHVLDRRYHDAVEHAATWLRGELEHNDMWTGAAWSNYYVLKALLALGDSRQSPVILKAVQWFLDNQDSEGRWMQVSQVHDTAMSILVLSQLLTVPLVDVSSPKLGMIAANRENGLHRVIFHGPDAGAMAPTDRLKITESVRTELGKNQQQLFIMAKNLRSVSAPNSTARNVGLFRGELTTIGRYAYGQIIPARIQMALERTNADHLRLDIDEPLIDLPWEILHDGIEFICLKFALGRRIISDQVFKSKPRKSTSFDKINALIVSNPTEDLPAAEEEGRRISTLLRSISNMKVDHFTGSAITKMQFLTMLGEYEIVHFAGHASCDPENPNENSLTFSGKNGQEQIYAREINSFLERGSPSLIFLNACWSAEEFRNAERFRSMTRGLGRTFLYSGASAFIGYLVPVPDSSATELAVTFYRSVLQGQTIGESLRRARLDLKERQGDADITWSAAVLYGDPTVQAITPPKGMSFY